MAPPPPVVGLFCCCSTILVVVVTVVTNTFPVRAVEEFKVGDAEGWRQPDINHTEIYTLWAVKTRFHVGDSLRFEYKNDSVIVVDKWAYYHCNTSNPSSVFTDGNTIINLDNPGPLYFISGEPNHCKNGQRLAVDVIPLHPISESSPPPSPHPDFADSPAPSPLSTSAAVAAGAVSVSATLLASALVWLSV